MLHVSGYDDGLPDRGQLDPYFEALCDCQCYLDDLIDRKRKLSIQMQMRQLLPSVYLSLVSALNKEIDIVMAEIRALGVN